MAQTLTLRPDAAGDETSINGQYPASDYHWDKVDEETPDEAETTVYTSSTTYLRDLYNLPASSGSETINKITVYFRTKVENTYCKSKASIKSDSTVTDGAEKTNAGTANWENHSQECALNPADGAAWAWADIDALQIGVSLIGISTGDRKNSCTQVYIEVDYTLKNPLPIFLK
ncbi:MAG: hypothetical protein Q7I94_07110 [Candidatus Contubernalis sp.]|nr:hypothetical protein [Candidatus Contubernalis sp.]